MARTRPIIRPSHVNILMILHRRPIDRHIDLGQYFQFNQFLAFCQVILNEHGVVWYGIVIPEYKKNAATDSKKTG